MVTKKSKVPIFLASQSPRRKELLRHMGIPFKVVRSAYREKIRRLWSPAKNALANAKGKVLSAKVNASKGIVIGFDTFIYFRGSIIGKPYSMKEACQMLRKLSGKSHYVYTGMAFLDLGTKKIRLAHAKSKVEFRRLDYSLINNYVEKWRPLDKAGSYAVQEDGNKLIRSVEGSISNVIGLPMELFLDELSKCLMETA